MTMTMMIAENFEDYDENGSHCIFDQTTLNDYDNQKSVIIKKVITHYHGHGGVKEMSSQLLFVFHEKGF